MIFNLKHLFRILVATLCLILLNTCATEFEKVARCKLDCKEGTIANADVVITPIVSDTSVSCNGSTTPRPVEIAFTISSPNTGTQGGLIPRSGVLVRPVLSMGTYDPLKSIHEEVEFKGIQTPKEKWCSDKCGIVTLSVWVECKADETLTHGVYLASGGATYSTPVTISAINPDPEEEEEEEEEEVEI